jgi:dihydrolipoamide dehydrogenase
MAKNFDVVVIGGGPAGYVAAIRAAQLGFSVACAESNPYADPKGEPRLGGTCLNVGCIPSKALLQSSENYHLLHDGFAQHGIRVKEASFDLGTMLGRKEKIVTQLTAGIRGLFRKNKVAFLPGHGRFTGRGGAGWQLEVGGEPVEAKHVIVATGSRARALPGVPVDNVLVSDNVGALSFDTVPGRLGIIGSGVIGLELGSVWKRLGAEVVILEALPNFLAACDEAVSREAWKVFTAKQGLDIRLGCTLGEIKAGASGVTVAYSRDGKDERLECDRLVVSIGRVPNTDGLGAEAVGLRIDARGFIEVDGHCRTTLPDVYAVGDVVRGPMLAHKGMEEGVMVAELIAGQAGHVNYEAIPWVIYTSPEIAWVGKTEQQLRSEGVEVRCGQVPFAASGRAMGLGDTTGFVKVIADAKTDRVLGVHVIGANASELISEAVVAMEFAASSEDIARISHAHPTLSEIMHEAALAVDKRPLHF